MGSSFGTMTQSIEVETLVSLTDTDLAAIERLLVQLSSTAVVDRVGGIRASRHERSEVHASGCERNLADRA